mgnify:CR=1 FL=1
MNRKGISPVIATVLLIGVAVFAVGAIFTFTQGQIGDLQGSTGSPQTSISIDVATEDASSAWCMNSDAVILTNNEGDSVSLDNMEVTLRTDSDPRPVTFTPKIDATWDPGQKLALHDISGAQGIALPDKDICQSVESEGSNSLTEGNTVNVVVSHKPTGNVIFEDSSNVISVVNSFI